VCWQGAAQLDRDGLIQQHLHASSRSMRPSP
jgi:hypothetical protein